jgi:hypothetical protein
MSWQRLQTKSSWVFQRRMVPLSIYICLLAAKVHLHRTHRPQRDTRQWKERLLRAQAAWTSQMQQLSDAYLQWIFMVCNTVFGVSLVFVLTITTRWEDCRTCRSCTGCHNLASREPHSFWIFPCESRKPHSSPLHPIARTLSLVTTFRLVIQRTEFCTSTI